VIDCRSAEHLRPDDAAAFNATAEACAKIDWSYRLVYAGVDVAAVGLFNGIRGKQLAGRFASIQTAPFPYGASAQRRDWRGVIVTLEQALTLHRHRPGALLRLDSYLHERTGGLIGSLSHLVRAAAIEAVLDGSERITKATLEAVTIDHAAEHVRPRIDARPRRGAGEVA